MKTGIYASAKSAILAQTLNLLDAGIKAMPVTDSYAPDYTTDVNLADVPVGARLATGVALANKSLVARH